MEMGGGSADSSSLNGLKFGKKIYFEDVGVGVSSKSSGGSSSISPSGGRRKGRGGSQGGGGGGVPRCQVEGCKLDLSGVKAYYARHKVCGMHSKSPLVIVGGLEQRFCQQCSRFHLLAEFDQGKRSCRRRLADHNERRRKPQPGSVFASPYGQVSPPSQGSSSRQGGFLMDFATYPRMPGRGAWPAVKSGNWAEGNRPTPTGKLLPHQWQGSSGNPPTIVYSQDSQCTVGATVYSSSRVPSDEQPAGVSDSSCALSLLSYQLWVPRNQTSEVEVNNSVNEEGLCMAQSRTPHSAVLANYTDGTWSLKDDNDVNHRSSHEMLCRFGLDQISQPVSDQFPGELELARQGGRQYMELGQSRDIGSPQMHWSL